RWPSGQHGPVRSRPRQRIGPTRRACPPPRLGRSPRPRAAPPAPPATDTAFVHVLRGIVALRSLEVTATVAGLLPLDDGLSPYQLS
ncbi:hypothetical protein MXD59_24745, partial [Frankia sp. Ag45/Mut15]|nr:hypothetical protein [Frankia umida]